MQTRNFTPRSTGRDWPIAIDELLMWLALDTRHTEPARRERLEHFIATSPSPVDALHAARLSLAAVMVDPHASSRAAADQVSSALLVLQANGQALQSAMCWRWLARYAWRRNAIDRAVHFARQAFAAPVLSVDFRVSLIELILPGLTQLLRFDEANHLLEHEFLPLLHTAEPSLAAGLAWTAVGFHQLECALRSGRIESEVAADLEGLRPCIDLPARERMRPDIDKARRALRMAREVGGPDVEPAVRLTEGVISALEGDIDAAFASLGPDPLPGASSALQRHNRACYLRLNGRWQAALDELLANGGDVAVPGNLRVERANCLEVAICATALARWELALGYERRYRHLVALANRTAADAIGLADVAAPPGPGALDPSVPMKRTMPPYVRRAIPLFEETLAERLTLIDMAARLGVSARSLQDGLRRYLESSFSDLYRLTAMRRAAELLHLPMLSVAEVAHQVGYRSTASFCREFRARHGRTPTEYRRTSAHAASPVQDATNPSRT